LNCCTLTSSRVLLYSCVLSTAFYRMNEWMNLKQNCRFRRHLCYHTYIILSVPEYLLCIWHDSYWCYIQIIYSPRLTCTYFALCVFWVDVIPCVAVTPIEADCASVWKDRDSQEITADSVQHYRTSTLKQCQKACEFDPRCVAIDVDYRSNADHCWININRHHTHTPFYFPIIKHHDLVSRCNITTGQCLHSPQTVLLWYHRVRWTSRCTYPDLPR